jgi:2-methylaconitate cis-trans-isomerase PrpF
MRGGTSKALMFLERDLPRDRSIWDRIFANAMGSPDPTGNQLNGMGGGRSSLSKVCVIGPPTRADADVDYTFAQIETRTGLVDYSGNCGNMSAAVGPFAIDEGLTRAVGAEAIVRIHNTNTDKIIVSRFPLEDGSAAVEGDFVVPGVAGTGAPIRLDFVDPGGAVTGRLLPSGRPLDRIEIVDDSVEVSLVDAANPCVFVKAEAVGMSGIELPEELEANHPLLKKLESIRIAASQQMGISRNPAEAARKPSVPKIAMVSAPSAAYTLAGEILPASAADITVRMISIGQPHRAIPLTGAMCLAVAARIEGTLVHRVARPASELGEQLRIAHPSGVTVVAASVQHTGGSWRAEHATVYRTARRLMAGAIYLHPSVLHG